MQILGKRSKILLIAVAIIMLVAVGISFATWDISAVKATNGSSSAYANAKVGDIIEFGRYYQTGNRISNEENAEYEKTAIEWIVVDKNERTGQLTLMSKYILAAGSYFGNWYYNTSSAWGAHHDSNKGVGGIPYNQAYVDSTVRAYLNNLERLDLGGDEFTSEGYLSSNKEITTTTGLLSSIGFSNQRYWTGQYTDANGNSALLSKPGFVKRADNNEIYYQRPIEQSVFKNRPATKGFYDEAFTNDEKSMIVPKIIAGYTGHRWPDETHDVSTKSYIEGGVDKIWIPSATELNVMEGEDWKNLEDNWISPSDEAGSTVFEYFKNYSQYKNPIFGTQSKSVADAIKTQRTEFAKNSFAMNYSIPLYNKGTTNELGSGDGNIASKINATANSTDHYWTRSPSSPWYSRVLPVLDSGLFHAYSTYSSDIGVRPCVILKY